MAYSSFLLLAALLPPTAEAGAVQEEVQWVSLRPVAASAEGGARLEVLEDGTVVASGGGGELESYRLSFEIPHGSLTGLALEALADPSLPSGGPGRSASGNYVLSELRVLDENRSGMKALAVGLRDISGDHSQQGWPVTSIADGDTKTGWAIAPATGRSHVVYLPLERVLAGEPSLRFSVELDFAFGQAHSLGRLRLLGTSSTAPVRHHADVEWQGMQERIDRAIDRGVAYLIAEQELDGSFAYHAQAFPGGQTALALYTLLKQHVPASHPSVRRALAYLQSELPSKTYTMGCLLLALATLDDPSLRPWMEELAEELLSWQNPGPDWPKGGFGYPEGAVDISNTQYGALGLWAAAKAGIAIPKSAWLELARHVVARHGDASRSAYDPQGFDYQPGGVRTGSRTAAGVTILAICEAELEASDLRTLPLVPAKERGLAWLAKNFSVKENPRCEPGDPWLYYYLYGVERVGSLLQLDHIGGADWYREGARFLVDNQAANGSWTPGTAEEQPNTCFAILFLSRATASSTGPSPTIGKKVYGQDDPESDLSLRASGDTPLSVWISSFGEELRRSYEWSSAAGGGLRASRFLVLEEAEARVPPAWSEARAWRWTTRAPGKAWTEPGFAAGSWAEGRGAFGDPKSGCPSVHTRWQENELYLVRDFDLGENMLVEPALWCLHGDPELWGGRSGESGPSVALFDEQQEFPAWLAEGPAGSRSEVVEESPASGKHALRVSGDQRFSARLPGWGYPIRENPRSGEYRYLRFAWRCDSAPGVMLQLADGGGWALRTTRYVAGENRLGFEPSLRVDAEVPRRWTVVTRDLWKDCGGDALLTGIACTSMGGTAFFDGIYLGRTRADLPELRAGVLPDEGAAATAKKKGGEGELRIWLNGQELWSAPYWSGTHEPLPLDPSWRSFLRTGGNHLAVALRASRPGEVLDLELRDEPILARGELDPARPLSGQRIAAQIQFASPGTRRIRARVGFVQEGAAPSEGPDWVDSNPLDVRIDEACDPDLLVYASDRTRNLLREAGPALRASSEMAGLGAAQAVDGLLASGWASAPGDAEPSLSLELARSLRVQRIQLVPLRSRRVPGGVQAQVARVKVLVNKKLEYELEVEPGEWRKSVLRLDRPVSLRQLELRFQRDLSASPGDPVGLAEVELMGER